jgi:hypothetical protein
VICLRMYQRVRVRETLVARMAARVSASFAARGRSQ